LVTQVFLTPDGHAQERTLLDEVLSSVQAKRPSKNIFQFLRIMASAANGRVRS
jgi:hypothetical protein